MYFLLGCAVGVRLDAHDIARAFEIVILLFQLVRYLNALLEK